MAYPTEHLRLVASGPLYTHEQWSWGLSLAPTPGAVVPDEVSVGVQQAVQGFIDVVQGSQAKLQLLKLNLIGEDGKYVSQTTVEHDYANAPYASSTSSPYPPQIAAVVTLQTEIRRGLAARGRFFIPVPRQVIASTDGRMAIAARDQIQGAAVTMLEALHTALPGWRVSVMSDVREGAAREVRTVRVGRVLDTMRSRRTAIPEEHGESAVLAGYPAGIASTGQFAGSGGAF